MVIPARRQDAYLSGVQRFLASIGAADEQLSVPADAHGQRPTLLAAPHERHGSPQYQRAAAVFVQKAPCRKVGGKVQQSRGDFCGKAVAGDGLRPERAGAIGERRRKIARAHVDAYAYTGAAQCVLFKTAAGLGEYAAELSSR